MTYNAKAKRLEYLTFGKGKKPLIMIQGLNTRGIQGMKIPLSYMYRIFAKDYTVYLFERRKNIDGDITVREMASDIAMAMDELNLTNADVFGVSQGGMIAQYLAIDRPDLVHRMVLAVTLSKNNITVQKTINHWIALTQREAWKELTLDMAVKMYSDNYIKRYQPWMPLLTILQKPKDAERFIKLAKSCLTCSAYDELEKIQCPVLVIGGWKDQVVGANASMEIAEKLGCEIYMYEDFGHGAYEEAKDFNQKVYEFLKSAGV